MFRTMKWIYRLGILHERRRVRLLIEQHKYSKPEKSDDDDDKMKKRTYEFDLELWYRTNDILDKLTQPELVAYTKEPIYKSPLDDDL